MVIALQAKSNTLQTQSASFEKALKAEQAKVSALDQHIVTLEQQLAALRRARYGRSSEQLDVNIYQLELMLDDLAATVGERTASQVLPVPLEPAQPQADQRKPRIPEHLPRTERVHEVNPRLSAVVKRSRYSHKTAASSLSMCPPHFE